MRTRLEAVGDGQSDFGHGQGAQLREQGMALLVDLSDDPGLGVGWQIIEGGAHLSFEQRPLVLDHKQGLQTAGEGSYARGLQGPWHGHLIKRDAEVGGFLKGEPHGA